MWRITLYPGLHLEELLILATMNQEAREFYS